MTHEEAVRVKREADLIKLDIEIAFAKVNGIQQYLFNNCPHKEAKELNCMESQCNLCGMVLRGWRKPEDSDGQTP